MLRSACVGTSVARRAVIQGIVLKRIFTRYIYTANLRKVTNEYTNHSCKRLLKTNGAQLSRRCYSTELPSNVKVVLPALSPTMETGAIINWQKKEGDKLSEGDLLAEIETDKATMGVESSDDGYLARILIPAGTKDIPIGKCLCIIVSEEADVAAFKDYVSTAADDQDFGAPSVEELPPPAPKPAASPVEAAPPVRPTPASASVKQSGRIFASPLARALASEKGIDLSTLQGSGPDGEIRGIDVLATSPSMTQVPSPPHPSAAQGAPVSRPAAEGSYQDLPTSEARLEMARRILQSKQTIPHYYLTVDVNMDNVVTIRDDLNKTLGDGDGQITVNDFIIKASALACRKVPETNSAWAETYIRQFHNVHVSISIATELGLMTPVVFKADLKGLSQLSEEIKNLAEKARTGVLHPQECQGGTFAVSNLGMFGVKNFCAVISPPQVCILATGGVQKRLVVDSSSNQGYTSASMMTVTLSCDHRVVDGAVGAQWLAAFKRLLERPQTMLL